MSGLSTNMNSVVLRNHIDWGNRISEIKVKAIGRVVLLEVLPLRLFGDTFMQSIIRGRTNSSCQISVKRREQVGHQEV
jgi:hypothetical protein